MNHKSLITVGAFEGLRVVSITHDDTVELSHVS